MNPFRLWFAFCLGWWLGFTQVQTPQPAIVPVAAVVPPSPEEQGASGTNRASRRRRAKLERVK